MLIIKLSHTIILQIKPAIIYKLQALFNILHLTFYICIEITFYILNYGKLKLKINKLIYILHKSPHFNYYVFLCTVSLILKILFDISFLL